MGNYVVDSNMKIILHETYLSYWNSNSDPYARKNFISDEIDIKKYFKDDFILWRCWYQLLQ